MRSGESRNRKVRHHRAVVCFLSPGIVVKDSASDRDKMRIARNQDVVNFILWSKSRIVGRDYGEAEEAENVLLSCLTDPVLNRSMYSASWGPRTSERIKVSPHKRCTLGKLQVFLDLQRNVFLDVGKGVDKMLLRVKIGLKFGPEGP